MMGIEQRAEMGHLQAQARGDQCQSRASAHTTGARWDRARDRTREARGGVWTEEGAAHILAAFASWPQLRQLQGVKIGGNPRWQLNFIILAMVMVAGEKLLRDHVILKKQGYRINPSERCSQSPVNH